MAYQIKCDAYPLLDMRDEDLILISPKVKLEANKVGSASFTIYDTHPYYSKLLKKKSIFEVSDEYGAIFRGRMTSDTLDFDNGKAVDLEGAMAFFNDSIVRPFSFPEDFAEDADYITAAESGNVIEFFLKWLIDNHNSQVQPWQRLKLGEVTVTDPNNYLSRSSTEYLKTWEVLKSRLFESALGGYLCIRYEDDGNYVDYMPEFALTNTQEIIHGENLLDLSNKSDATETYSAMIPLGKTVDTTTETEDGASTTKETVMIAGLPDGNITDDIVKQGDTLYSKSAVEAFGWVYAPVSETTWADVATPENLLTKAVAWLTGKGIRLNNTRTITAVDLHFSDSQIRSFRVCRNVITRSAPHGLSDTLGLTKLDLDLLNPQNTKISIGETRLSLTDQNSKDKFNIKDKIESVRDELKGYVALSEKTMVQKIEGIDGLYFYIRYSEYADGHVMTNAPNDSTQYMGTCSTNQPTAPTDCREYTWCKIAGKNGVDGKDGIDGKDGVDGKDGTSVSILGTYETEAELFAAHPTGNVGDAYIVGSDLFVWTGEQSSWLNVGRIQGDPGKDGTDGIDGVDGKDGKTYYTWIKYADDANGANMSNDPAGKFYIGIAYNKENPIESDSVSDYTWSLFRGSDGIDGKDGEQGIPGQAGADGRTQYLHIKYSDDGETFTDNNGETLGAYIGTLVDFNEADSTVFTDYTWKKFTEDVDEELDELHQIIIEQNTSLVNNCEEIILKALESYVETSNYEEFRETVEAQLQVMAGEIALNFTTTSKQVTDVDGDLQEKFTQLYKFIRFSDENAIVIGSGDSAITLEIDNETGIVFKRDDIPFGRWDGENFYTGNIVVEVNERAQFGNFAFVPRSDGSLSFLKVGG